MASDGPPPGDDPLVHEALVRENAALRDRIGVLESAVAEYRRQMDELLTSSSWRLTSPIRIASGRARRWRTRAGRSLRARPGRARAQAPTTGLFPGASSALLASTPVPAAPSRDHPVRERRVLVAAHVHYAEVWPDIADRLARIPEPFDLVVTVTKGPAESVAHDVVARVPGAKVLPVDNRGRDWLPLLELVRSGAVDGYDAVLKVHTKRSPHRLDGDGWRVALLDGLLPSPSGIAAILGVLREDPDAGLVAAPGQVAGPEAWGADLAMAEALAARLPLGFDPEALPFPAGSMFWARPWLLRRLLDFGLGADDFVVEAGHTDGTCAHALERMVGVLAASAGLDVVESDQAASRLARARRPRPARPLVVAAYLPQFHRIPENDGWWGQGFTDWSLVARSRPQFRGHRQPEQPGELGRYDLRDPDVLRAQAALARNHGIDGFLIYHYWFGGRRLLEAPALGLLDDPSIDLPFALCWANENWTRRWDGLDDDVLVEQTYPAGWADAFFADALPFLRDPRAIRIDGRPLLAVYRPGDVPDAAGTAARWRELAAREGLGGLHLVGMEPSPQFGPIPDDAAAALDAVIAMPPASGFGYHDVTALAPDLAPGFTGGVLNYAAAAAGTAASSGRWPGVLAGWDNTPRRGEAAWVFQGSHPAALRGWVRRAVAAAAEAGAAAVVVNAWNEWGEGAHLEPCERFGRGWLEAVLDAAGPVAGTTPGEHR